MAILITSCDKKNDNTKSDIPLYIAANCGGCHMVPDPTLLDKNTWKKRVLPAMAKQLGLEVWQESSYFQGENAKINIDDWNKILAYYDSLAPESLAPLEKFTKPGINQTLFELLLPPVQNNTIATTTVVKIDTIDHRFWFGTAAENKLSILNSALKPITSIPLPSPPVAVFNDTNHAIITCIGDLKAIDVPLGGLYWYDKASSQSRSIIPNEKFIRPINTIEINVNNDGLKGYIVSAFGHNEGGLYLLKQKKDRSFEKIAIREIAGATQSVVTDFNNDGWADFITLFAHGDEGIWLFLNDKKGSFETICLLRFPPVYGSSSFQFIDMDQDNNPDIVYTAGDNSDYSRILKPYHGVYIFKNMGNKEFKQHYFYPINGCTKAIAADFDKDGKMDIATIAFFADLKNKSFEKFIYLKNSIKDSSPNFQFEASYPDIELEGRWICMDAGDVDGDGDIDIMLGNYSKGFINQENVVPNWNIKTPFIILKNKTH